MLEILPASSLNWGNTIGDIALWMDLSYIYSMIGFRSNFEDWPAIDGNKLIGFGYRSEACIEADGSWIKLSLKLNVPWDDPFFLRVGTVAGSYDGQCLAIINSAACLIYFNIYEN